MIVVQFFICIMAPVVLFQDSYILLGVVAVINLFVHTWSFSRFLRATGTPPGLWGAGCQPSTVIGNEIGSNQTSGQDFRFLKILSGVNQLTLALSYGLLMYVVIQRISV